MLPGRASLKQTGGRELKRIVFDEETIARRVRELGQEITAAYPDGELLVLGLLKGSFIFLSDLVRRIERPLQEDFLVAASYGVDTISSGNVRLLYDPETELQGHQPVERISGIHNVFHQQDVLTPQLRFWIVQQPHVPTRNRIDAVARGHQEVHLERPLDAAHEIAQKNEAPLEEAEYEELAVGVRCGDLLTQLADAPRDRLFVEDDPLELTPAGLLEARRAW